jgi:hypothetical protein
VAALIASINPLACAVDAARAVFNGQLDDVSVLKGVVMSMLALISTVVAARQFGRPIA